MAVRPQWAHLRQLLVSKRMTLKKPIAVRLTNSKIDANGHQRTLNSYPFLIRSSFRKPRSQNRFVRECLVAVKQDSCEHPEAEEELDRERESQVAWSLWKKHTHNEKN